MESYRRILRGGEYLQHKMNEANESKVDGESQFYDDSEVEALVGGEGTPFYPTRCAVSH
jgi:acylphosphatase